MKLKKTFMACLLMFGFLSASAQDQQPKTEYVHNPYWYLQIQAGAQHTLGEINFDKLISPNVQIAFGRQFTPVFGARLAVNAWQSKAGIEKDGNVAKWNWKYVAPGVDAMFNLSNLFCGYNPNRIFNFSVFAGIGANIAWDNDCNGIISQYKTLYPKSFNENIDYVWDGTKVRFFGRAGIAADFRVSDAVSIGLEVNANTLSDRYNSKRAGNTDWYFNALAGVKIDLGSRYTTRTIEAPKPVERVVEKVIERVIEKPAPQPIAPTRAIAAKKEEKFQRNIFFTISSTVISKSERTKVEEVAEYLKKNPNAKVEITGYADKGTGSARFNKALSQRRAQSVANMLIKNYGIKASRITVDSKGDTVQPFAKNIENRAAICISE